MEIFSMYTTQEAAEILDVSDAYLRQLIGRNQLAAKRIGKRTWVIPESELERLKNRPRRRKPKGTT